MVKRSRASRFAVVVSPEIMNLFSHTRAAWYETEEDVAAGLERGRRRAALLRWVRKQMGRRLTTRERNFLELYFFEGLTYRDTAEKAGTNVSYVHRTVQRAIGKLRAAAAEDHAKLKRYLNRRR